MGLNTNQVLLKLVSGCLENDAAAKVLKCTVSNFINVPSVGLSCVEELWLPLT